MEDTSKNEILEAIGEFSNRVDQELTLIKGEIGLIKGDVTSLKGEVMAIKSTMVTKDYLDDKLLNKKNVLSDIEAKSIFALEPFPNR